MSDFLSMVYASLNKVVLTRQANGLFQPQSAIDDIRIAAPMYDLGKVGIPDRILLKAGALNDDEFSDMKRHTIISAQMLEGTGIPVLEWLREPHGTIMRWWEVTGYPGGLIKGDEIPLEARITAGNAPDSDGGYRLTISMNNYTFRALHCT